MKFLPVIVMAIAMLAACSNADSSAGEAEPSALVSVARAGPGDVETTMTVFGTVEQNAGSQMALSAPAEAMISRIVAPVGTAVARGQVILVLSPSPNTRSEGAQLSASATAASQAYDRAMRLRRDGLASDADVETARAAAQSAQAARGAAATKAGQLILRAPFAGFVETIANSPGEMVAAGTTIVTIARSGDMRARFRLDQGLLGRLSRGAGINVSLPTDEGDNATTLPIAAIDPTIDPQSRQASIYVNVPGANDIGAGQPLKGVVTLERAAAGSVTVPYAALLDDGGQPYVFVVSKGIALRKDVTVSASDGTTAAISSGVNAGDMVVTQGGTALDDGMKVRTK